MNVQLKHVTDEDVKAMHEATCELLIDCGVRVQSERFIQAASDAGLHIGKDEKTGNTIVKFTQKDIDTALSTVPHEFTLYGINNPDYKIEMGAGKAYAQSCVGTPFFLDIETGRRRNTTLQDEIDWVRAANALSDIDLISDLTAQGIPDKAALAIQASIMVKNTSKVLSICTCTYKEVEQVEEILYAVSGSREAFLEKPFAYLQPSPISPMEYGLGPADAVIGIAERGLPLGIIPCPMMGATGPITVIGSVVMHNAEILAGVVLTQLMKPGLKTVMSPHVCSMDMVNTQGLYAAPEMGLAAAASMALTAFYGIPTQPAGYVGAAKVPDAQAAFESCYQGMLEGLSGASVVGGAGSLDNALTASIEKLVLDNEISSMVKRAVAGEVVDRDTMAVDAVKELFEKGKRDFLSSKHTRKHLRTELWKPILSDRSLYAQWEQDGAPTFEDRVKAEAKRLLAEPLPEVLTPEQIARVDAVVEKAIKEAE